MMTFLRLLYVVCWRNRVLIPLIITCASFAMVITLFYHKSMLEAESPLEYMPHRNKLALIDSFKKRGVNSITGESPTRNYVPPMAKHLADQMRKISQKTDSNYSSDFSKHMENSTLAGSQETRTDDSVRTAKVVKYNDTKAGILHDVHENKEYVLKHSDSKPKPLVLDRKQGLRETKDIDVIELNPNEVKYLKTTRKHREQSPLPGLKVELDNGHKNVIEGSSRVIKVSVITAQHLSMPQKVEESMVVEQPVVYADKMKLNMTAVRYIKMRAAEDKRKNVATKSSVPVKPARLPHYRKRPRKVKVSKNHTEATPTSGWFRKHGVVKENLEYTVKFQHGKKPRLESPDKQSVDKHNYEKDTNKKDFFIYDQRAIKTAMDLGNGIIGNDSLPTPIDKHEQPDVPNDINVDPNQNMPLFKPVTIGNIVIAHQELSYHPKRTNQSLVVLTPELRQQLLERRPPTDFRPRKRTMVYRNINIPVDVFTHWAQESLPMCQGKFTGYHNEFALVHNITLDLKQASGRKGGENIEQVWNQPEEEEYYQFLPGFITISCIDKPDYFFNNQNHLNSWWSSIITHPRNSIEPIPVIRDFTIAITRYEYANIYHTMTDIYNAFLMMEFFNKTQQETNILIVDGHPKGALDVIWETLFNSTVRLSHVSDRVHFTNMVWGILGYNSPMMDHFSLSIPLLNEFREFFLSTYKVVENRTLNCDKVSILFIWRRDYVAHPRNPSGSISRKILNDQELVMTLRRRFPKFRIRGIQIDLFDMQQQLQFIAETDILIGMHGAGLTHAFFLPQHGGLIELLPTYWSAANEHFEAITHWRNLLYQRWVNEDPNNEEPDNFTKVPPSILNDMVKSMVHEMCNPRNKTNDFMPPTR